MRAMLLRIILPCLLLTGLALDAYASEPNMFDHMKTYCFGRYLVDIPVQAKLINAGNKYGNAAIEARRLSLEEFNALVDKRISGLKAKDPALGIYRYDSEIKLAERARILLSKEEAFGSLLHRIDSFKLDNGIAFLVVDDPYEADEIGEAIERQKQYLSNVRHRQPDEIPREPGFCFGEGFVANDGNSRQAERATLAFEMDNNRDVWIDLSSDVYFRQEKSLLARFSESNIKERFPGKIQEISVKPRAINGMDGEELLAAFPSTDETGLTQDFTWETLGSVGDPLHPGIHLNITTGRGVAGRRAPSSMTTSQVRELYEAIVKTIRLRPTDSGGDGPAPEPAGEPKAPIGTSARTGEMCPESGWWHAYTEAGEETGVQVRFGKGDRLPQATWYPTLPFSWMERVLGVRGRTGAVVWRLAEHIAGKRS